MLPFVYRYLFRLQINDPVRNAQEAFQMEVHAARVVRFCYSLSQSFHAKALGLCDPQIALDSHADGYAFDLMTFSSIGEAITCVVSYRSNSFCQLGCCSD